jgi:light-regulated signal transduction histidine kinase (bacteriophytochrome)
MLLPGTDMRNNRERELLNEIELLKNELAKKVAGENDLLSLIKELQRSNSDLENIACVMLHDLRQPLGTSGNFIRILAKNYRDKLDDEAIKIINYALTNNETVAKLLQYFVESALLEPKKLHPKILNFNRMVEEIIISYDIIIKSRKVTVTHDILPTLEADYCSMMQVLLNLIGNAINHSQIKNPVIHISAESSENECVFSVHDNGKGIPETDLKEIFNIFHSTDTIKPLQLKGLGLTLCQRAIQRHNGNIWAESQTGKGTTFFFSIPLTRKESIKEEVLNFSLKA